MEMETAMSKKLVRVFVPLLVAASVAVGQQKLAQTGMKFVAVSTDARAEGMGEAVTSIEGNSLAMFFNPAGMARIDGMATASVGEVTWIADIKHIYGSVAYSPANGDYGVFGLNFRSVNYGDLDATIIANNANGFLDLGTFSPSAYTFGLGYAKALSDKFSIGGCVNFVHQDLGSSVIAVDDAGNMTNKTEKQSVYSFDFGLMYKTGFKSLAFGMDLRNFSRELKYEQESFQLPLTFRLGISMNVLDLWDVNSSDQSLLVTADATHPRDYQEQVSVGVEYTFLHLLSLRGGYMFNTDEAGLTGGLGVRQKVAGVDVSIDYSYTPYGVFTSVQRFSLGVGF